MDFRLERLHPVLARLEHPESAFPSIHVAGTNGKGSTAAMLHAVYVEAGYRVGLYTSPHLFSFCERIRVGRDAIGEDRVVELVGRVRRGADEAGEALTFFEIATIAAFLEFRDAEVDLAVIETGLGGKLDATNVVRSVACAITGVALDHCEFLGETVEAVAKEKAGIVRGPLPVVVGRLDADADRIVASRCRARGATLIRADVARAADLEIGLAGAHQSANAAIVMSTVDALAEGFPVTREAVERGIAGVRWPGRFEMLRAAGPAVIVDGGHNPQAMRALAGAVHDAGVDRPLALVFGAMKDKDWAQMLEILAPAADRVYLVPVDSARSFVPADAEAQLAVGAGEVCGSALEGLEAALGWCEGRGTVLVTGSIFLVAELYAACRRAGGSGVDAAG
jgi:dihydrofolate synthase/folylpolyglutamate synthase